MKRPPLQTCLLTLALAGLVSACTQDNLDPVEPQLTWVSINAETVVSATTPVVVTLASQAMVRRSE